MLALSFVLVVAGCGSDDQGESSGDTEPTDAVDAATVSGDVEASIVDFIFEPEAINVTVNSKVTWTNEDAFAHTVTAVDGDESGPDSGNFGEGEAFTFTFDEVGQFPYFCAIHNQMKGIVVVS